MGSEEVTNGDFATDTDWVKEGTWTISNGAANRTAQASGFELKQTFSVFNSNTWKVSFEIISISNGGCGFRLNGGSVNTYYTEVGVYTETIIASGAASDVIIQANSTFAGSIDNVTVKESTKNNLARVDYDGTASSLLVEPQRTNDITYSSDFTQWGNARTTDTANQTISPDGSVNATYLEQNTGETNAGSIYLNVTLIAADYSFSIFAKKKEKDFIVAYDSNTNRTYFNISNGTLGNNGSGGTSKIEDYGNGWYRCSVSYAESSAASTNIAWYLGDTNGSTTVTDSGGVYIYGCQVEEGSYPTSYIPTSGISLTRNQDQYSKTGISNLIGQTEGTVYWEIDVETLVATANENILNIDAGSFANTIYFIKTVSGNITAEMYVSGSQQATFTKTNITKGVHKMAMGYANNNTAFFIDGNQVGVTDISCTVPATNRLQLGAGVLGASDGKIKSLQLYKTRLSNPELATLTTI